MTRFGYDDYEEDRIDFNEEETVTICKCSRCKNYVQPIDIDGEVWIGTGLAFCPECNDLLNR